MKASHFPAPFVYSTVLRFVQFPSSFPLHIVAFHFLLAPGFRSPPVARLASASDVSRFVHFGVAHLCPLLHALGHFDRSAGASRLYEVSRAGHLRRHLIVVVVLRQSEKWFETLFFHVASCLVLVRSVPSIGYPSIISPTRVIFFFV